jgi:hypothetical protein
LNACDAPFLGAKNDGSRFAEEGQKLRSTIQARNAGVAKYRSKAAGTCRPVKAFLGISCEQ